MKQFCLRWLLSAFIAGSWLSLEVAHCGNIREGISSLSYCYNTSAGNTCFTTFLANNNRPVRKTFKAASDWCQTYVPGSSLVIINSLEDQRTVESFIGRQTLANETIFTNARKLSEGEGRKWLWVNDRHQEIPKEVNSKNETYHDGACVVFVVGKPLTYCVGNVTSTYHYICEYSDSKRTFSYQRDNKYYVAINTRVTWYEARNECLRLGGDLATDLGSINGNSWLRESHRYWIGLHRNQWIWNRTGAAVTYTNWEGGYPDESPDKQCIYISPKCSTNNNQYTCITEDDRKWWTCNCNDSHAFVCQTDTTMETTPAPTSARTTPTPVKTTTTPTTQRTSSVTFTTRDSPVNLSEDQTTGFSKEPSTDREMNVSWLAITLAIFITLFAVTSTYIIFKKIRNRNKRTAAQTESSQNTVRAELRSSEDAYETLSTEEQTGTKAYAELQLYETIEDGAERDIQ